MHMTKHGLDAFVEQNLPGVHFKCSGTKWLYIPCSKFKYCAPDVVYAPVTEEFARDNKVHVKFRTPEVSDWGNVFSVEPMLATARGAIVSIDSQTEHYRYSVATKPGDSGCGIWSDDGVLLGMHTDGSRTTNGGTFVNKRWVDLVSGKKTESSHLKL
jgi:hypothetical protein